MNQPYNDPAANPIGSLERLGIPVETILDPNVLSPGTAKSVHFRVSKPQGYSFQEVDDFVENIVVPSIDWFTNMLYHRDKAVHTLGTMLDQAETDIKNLNGQLQFAEYNSQIKKGIDLNADDKEVAALLDRLEAAESELARLRAGGAVVSDAPDTTELEKYIEQISAQYNELVEQYEVDTNELKRQLAAALENAGSATAEPAATIDPETQQYIEQLTTQYNELLERYETDTAALRAEAEANLAKAGALPSAADETDVAELNRYIEQISAQYQELVTQYETDTKALQAQIDERDAQISNLGSGTSTASGEVDPDTAAYIEQITAQYTELTEMYERDTKALQDKLDAYEGTDAAALNDYIEQITAQYGQLLEQYNLLVAEGGSDSTAVGRNDPLLEQENASLKSQVAALETQLAEARSAHPEDIEEEEETAEEAEARNTLKLQTEERNRNIDSSKYGNLPPGIRPDDLE